MSLFVGNLAFENMEYMDDKNWCSKVHYYLQLLVSTLLISSKKKLDVQKN